MKHILPFVLLLLCFVAHVEARASVGYENIIKSSSDTVWVVGIIDPRFNNTHKPRMPRQHQYIEIYYDAIKIYGQFGDCILTLWSETGALLCQVSVPFGADEVTIPRLQCAPAEVRISDGVNEYIGYIE